jgi:hypothetical protein
MNTTEHQQQFAGDVVRLRRAVRERAGRIRWMLSASLVGGLVAGLAVWFCQPVHDRDGDHLGFSLSLGALTFFLGGMLGCLLFPRPSANCPQCGCDWHAESENNTQVWLAWQHCPSCGLGMPGENAGDVKP